MSDARAPIASRTEWVVAGLSAALLMAGIGYLVYDGLAGGDAPPFVTVAAESVTDTLGGRVVRFRAHNHGDRAAESVVVRGELVGADGRVREDAEARLEFVPGRGARTGGLFFGSAEPGLELRLSAAGYVTP